MSWASLANVAGGPSACRSCRRLSPRPGAGRGDHLPGLAAAAASRLAALPARRASPGGAAAGVARPLCPSARAAAVGRGAGATGVPALWAARAWLRQALVRRVPAQRAGRLLLPPSHPPIQPFLDHCGGVTLRGSRAPATGTGSDARRSGRWPSSTHGRSNCPASAASAAN